MRQASLAVAAALALSLGMGVSATPISVYNSSFEIPALPVDGAIYGGGYVWYYNQTGWYMDTSYDPSWWTEPRLPPGAGWSDVPWIVGEYRLTGYDYLYPAGIPEGVQVSWIMDHPAMIWQEVPATLQAGLTYTLTAATGCRSNAENPFAPSTLYLYAASSSPALNASSWQLLKSTDLLTPAAGTFIDQSLTFGPADPGYAALLAAWAGKPLVIGLYSAGATVPGGVLETDWDNVRLDASVLPEPASLALVGLGCLALLRRRV